MDAALVSHVIYWFIGALSVVTAVGAVVAMVSMGRSSYRRD